MSQIKILHISPNFNYTCGISKYLTIVLDELRKNKDIKLTFITNGGDSLERLKKIGIEPVVLNFSDGFKNVFHLRNNLKELETFCIKNNIDIIHTHHRYPEFLACQLRKKLKIKTITTVHSLVKGFKNISFKSDKIIAVSKAVEQNLIKNFNVSSNKIIQMYNPIDFNNNVMYDENGLEFLSKYHVLLFIGRNNKVKGIELLIQAFNKISVKHPDLALVIVSDLKERQRKKITRENKNVFVFPPQRDVCKFYRVAEMVIMPSILESFPYVMLESGLYKKLFIGSNVGGIKEFIEDGINGLIFESGNVNALIDKVYQALEMNEDTKKIIVDNLHKKVLNLSSPQSYSENLVSIYKQLL